MEDLAMIFIVTFIVFVALSKFNSLEDRITKIESQIVKEGIICSKE